MPMSVFVLYRVGGDDEAADEDNGFTFQHPSDVRGLIWSLLLVVVLFRTHGVIS